MPLTQRGIETIFGNANELAKARGLESEGRKVALHLLDVVLAEELQVLNGAVLPIIDGHRAHLIEGGVKSAEMSLQLVMYRLTCGAEGAYAFLDAPNLVDCSLNGADKFGIHFVAVVEKPGAFLRLRHIAQYHY